MFTGVYLVDTDQRKKVEVSAVTTEDGRFLVARNEEIAIALRVANPDAQVLTHPYVGYHGGMSANVFGSKKGFWRDNARVELGQITGIEIMQEDGSTVGSRPPSLNNGRSSPTRFEIAS